MENKEFRELSGSVDGNRLEAFIYLLIRDHMPAGRLEKVIMEVENIEKAQFTNGYLAKYAKLLSNRIIEN